jgi:hypothetical protein
LQIQDRPLVLPKITKKNMLIEPLNCLLYIFDFGGTSVDIDVKYPEPIRMALQAEGGSIRLKKVYFDTENANRYFMLYTTLCGKIKISLQLDREDYEHNLGFFDSDDVRFDSHIKFGLNGNKFTLCETE